VVFNVVADITGLSSFV